MFIVSSQLLKCSSCVLETTDQDQQTNEQGTRKDAQISFETSLVARVHGNSELDSYTNIHCALGGCTWL